ncbi:hypothetical protein GA0115250_126919, partial [Streptomyces sp. BvitLS-983]
MDEDGDAGDQRGPGEAEEFLELDGEDRALGIGVVEADARAARYLQPLRGQFVQAARLTARPRQQAAQAATRVDAAQVGAAPGPSQLRLQPLLGAGQQGLLRDVRPGAAHRPVQEGEAPPQFGGLPAPAQQPEPLALQTRQQRRPDLTGAARAGQRPYRQFDGAQPLHPAGDHVAAGPADLLAVPVQRRRRPPGRRLVDRGRQPHPGPRPVHRPVRDRHRQPAALP